MEQYPFDEIHNIPIFLASFNLLSSVFCRSNNWHCKDFREPPKSQNVYGNFSVKSFLQISELSYINSLPVECKQLDIKFGLF